MKIRGKIIAGIFALTFVMTVSACTNNKGSGSSSDVTSYTSETTKATEQTTSASSLTTTLVTTTAISSAASVTTASDSSEGPATGQEIKPYSYETLKNRLPEKQLEDKTVTMLTWKTAAEDSPKSTGLEIFKEKYGGNVENIQTTYDSRLDTLTKYILIGDSPDCMPADTELFPSGAIKDIFEPVENCIDLTSQIWLSSKSVYDNFIYNESVYCVPINLKPCFVCAYNTKTIKENGLTDPYELYLEGKWTFSEFAKMCSSFTDKSAEKYGLDGYNYSVALNNICGVPLIGMENGRLVSNFENKKVNKIQDSMYDLENKGVCFPKADNGWLSRGSGKTGEGVAEGLTLFEPVSLDELEEDSDILKNFGDVQKGEVMFVPMPRADDDKTFYSTATVDGYMLCKGAKNPEGFGALMDSLKVCSENDSYNKEMFLKKNCGWSDKMLDMRKEATILTKHHPVFDFSYGGSTELTTYMQQNVNNMSMLTNEKRCKWSETVKNSSKAVKDMLEKCNK